jgi:hypothetical protein
LELGDEMQLTTESMTSAAQLIDCNTAGCHHNKDVIEEDVIELKKRNNCVSSVMGSVGLKGMCAVT